ncbi:hypothetical protein ACFO3I_03810 [Rheinheimera marina]|uniref:DUF2393 domain-containing protein n=1 Tax=Rheinheimera marina TaxID=1774958 RepID=A0ABV9JHI7_9GAMM
MVLATALSLCMLMAYAFLQRVNVWVRHTLLPLSLLGFGSLMFSFGYYFDNPVFQQTYQAPLYKENASSNLTGQRIVSLASLNIQFSGCFKQLTELACRLELINQGKDADFAFHSKTSAFDPQGNALQLKALLVGEKKYGPRDSFDLAKNIKRPVTLVFELNNSAIGQLDLLRLHFDHFNQGETKGVKFSNIPL